MTKSTQRARDASKPKSAVRQRDNKTRTGGHAKAGKRASPDGTYHPTDVEPEEFFKAWSREERAALIELLIDSLDAEAGDADLEPSLGFLEPDLTSSDNDARQDILQGSTSDGEDGGDDEPSLGFQAGDVFVGRGYVGRGYEHCGGDDLEEACEDEGAQCDDEGDRSDTGIGDADGLLEQVGGTTGFARAAV